MGRLHRPWRRGHRAAVALAVHGARGPRGLACDARRGGFGRAALGCGRAVAGVWWHAAALIRSSSFQISKAGRPLQGGIALGGRQRVASCAARLHLAAGPRAAGQGVRRQAGPWEARPGGSRRGGRYGGCRWAGVAAWPASALRGGCAGTQLPLSPLPLATALLARSPSPPSLRSSSALPSLPLCSTPPERRRRTTALLALSLPCSLLSPFPLSLSLTLSLCLSRDRANRGMRADQGRSP